MTKKHICKLSATVIKYIFIQYLLLIIISIELYYVEHCTDFQIGYHHPHFWIDPKKANTHSLGLLFPPWQREDSVFLTPLKLSLCTKAECPEATKAQDQALRAMMLKDGRTQEPATPRNKAKCRVRKAGHCEDRLFGKKTTAVPAASSVEYPISGSHG